MPARVVDNILELIGDTPLIRLGQLSPAGGATIWAKTESFNPSGSVKDRPALAMIEDAESRGVLRAGMRVVEATSGNMGVALALVCAVKGYRVVVAMPESMSLERRSLLEAHGVKVVRTKAELGMRGAIDAANELAAEPNSFMPSQFENPANVDGYASAAAEILTAMAGTTIDAFVAGVSTGATLVGIARGLRERNPALEVHSVEPAASTVLQGGAPGPTKIQGLGPGFVSKILDNNGPMFIRTATDREAYEMKTRLAREEGLLVGISSGANVAVAIDVARALRQDQNVVTVLPDTGERYFSLDEYFKHA